MNPFWTSLARRNKPAVAAIAAFVLFVLVHEAAFRPALARYRRDVHRAVELGMPLEGGTPSAPSGRLTNLLTANSMAAGVAEEQGGSGGLAAGLLDEATRLAARHGLEVVSAEQGMVTQLPTTAQVRVHLRLRGGYADLVGLVGDLTRSRWLIALDRFTVRGGSGDREDIEVWLSQLVLKRTRGAR